MLSKVINLLRFPMAVLVVFCHCKILWGVPYNGELYINNSHIVQSIQILCSEVIPHIAVPIFLFFSGFLFFKNGFSKEIYFTKIKSRAKTLLVPYIIWCSIGFIIALYNNECTLSFSNYIKGFWDTSLWGGSDESMIAFNNMPADMPLWFVRDLIVIIILSPLVYILAKRVKGLFIAIIGIWWFTHIMPKPLGFGADTIFFFSLGAWFSINKVDFIESTKKIMPYIYPASIILMVADFIIVDNIFSETGRMGYNWYIFNAFIITASISVLHLSSKMIEIKDIRISQFWTSASFFLFATHALYMIPLRSLLFGCFYPETDLGCIIFYFADIAIVIFISVIFFALLRQYTPRLCNILTGGRL